MMKQNKKNKKILVVDDALFSRRLLGNTMNDIGYSEIYFAENEIEALKMARELTPDLITLDISMAGMNGIEMISKILKASSKSKIIMVSGGATPHNIVKSIKSGAVDFIAKPFNKMQVEEMVQQHI